MKKNNQSGFSIIAVVLLVAIIALVGVIGWRVFVTQKDLSKSNSAESTQQNVTQATSPAGGGEIKSSNDITTVQKSLDTAAIDADLDSSALDQDLNSLY